jgi:hypothetical protein
MVLRLKKLAARSGSSAALQSAPLHRTYTIVSAERQYLCSTYFGNTTLQLLYVVSPPGCNFHYCLTDLSVDSNDITALVSGEQKHYFHL